MAGNTIDGVELDRCGFDAILTGEHPMRPVISKVLGTPSKAIGNVNQAFSATNNLRSAALELGRRFGPR